MCNVKELADVRYRLMFEKRYKGGWVSIAFCHDEVKPWRVGFASTGHYFDSAEAAAAYCAGRGFIKYSEVSSVTDTVERLSRLGE